MARRFGQMLEGDLAIMNKTRPGHDEAAVTEVIGRVEGKVAIMSDDIIVTGGTLIAGAEALLEAGRDRGLRLRDARALPRQRASRSSRRASSSRSPSRTRSRSTRSTGPAKIDVLPVSSLLAETILNVFADDSVSAIFAGENQLF